MEKYGYATGKVAKEIAILKRLQHENIVKVIDVLDNPDEDKLYIVMEYLPSGALLPDWEANDGDQNCDINPLSEETVRVIYRDIALAMLYIHTHNVVHRDIKPSNILMSRSGVGHGSAKLADFGVAHIFADENENVENLETFINGPMVGTPMFRPPECFTPEDVNDLQFNPWIPPVLLKQMLAIVAYRTCYYNTRALVMCGLLECHCTFP